MEPPAAHDHFVTTAVTLECGHIHTQRHSADTIAGNPVYARPDVQWRCFPSCGDGVPPKRFAAGFRHRYGCTVCAPVDPKDAPPRHAALPTFRPFRYGHLHGFHDVAGWVVVRTTTHPGGRVEVADARAIVGPGYYAHAIETVRELDAQAAAEVCHRIVTIYADGCRNDRFGDAACITEADEPVWP
ncbi:hypothetical protein [Actinokineospora enzanensis]|uniref:hypothetical protein n=1 Tax=Actinokineospora enzanensis TaxID=155975 RepID=UPI0012EBFCDF|nr:hypothetical protein [Actinokineospora enzanensis]